MSIIIARNRQRTPRWRKAIRDKEPVVWQERARRAAGHMKGNILLAGKLMLAAAVREFAEARNPTKKAIREAARDYRRTKKGKAVCTIHDAECHLSAVAEAAARFRAARARARILLFHAESIVRYDQAKQMREWHQSPDNDVPVDVWCGPVYGRKGHTTPNSELRPGRIEAELDNNRREEILAHIDPGTHGHAAVEWVAAPDLPWVQIDRKEDWTLYKGRHKNRPALACQVTVFARNMLRRDMPGGRRVIGGLITLAADPIPFRRHCWSGVIMWKAAWTRKARGIEYHTDFGLIAECAVTGAVYHLQHPGRASKDDYARAAKGLRRKVGRDGASVASRQEVERVAKDDPFPVTMRIAQEAGLCRPGILDFAARFLPGVDPEQDSVPLGRLVRILRRTGDGYAHEAAAIVGLINFRRIGQRIQHRQPTGEAR